jgi:hypothetical protein
MVPEDACSFFFKHMTVFVCNLFVEMFLADLTSCGLNLQFKVKVIIICQQQIIENNSLTLIMQVD